MLVCRASCPCSSAELLCGLLQVLSVSPELQGSGEVTKVTAYTSDLIELVSGVCPVSPSPPSTLEALTSHQQQHSISQCCMLLRSLLCCYRRCMTLL